MMQSGAAIKQDAEFEYVLRLNREVEVVLDGEIEYRGALLSFSRDMFQVPCGDHYLRRMVEVKTV